MDSMRWAIIPAMLLGGSLAACDVGGTSELEDSGQEKADGGDGGTSTEDLDGAVWQGPDLEGVPGDADVRAELYIVTEQVPSGAEGVNYEVELRAEGGSYADYRWSLASGRLPSGVFLRSEGTPTTFLAGVPRTAGTFEFTLRVRDSESNEASRMFSLTVEAAAPPVEIVTTTLPSACLGDSYEAAIQAQNGEGLAWSLVSGQLPPGLELDATGPFVASVRGTPTDAGRYSFTVRVTDAEGNRDTAQFEIEVLDC